MNILCFATILLSSSLQSTVYAHTRLECPPPRSGKTGEKSGPCDAEDNLSLPAYPLIPGAFNTITWLESIPHPGAPGRLALSLDGDDSMESFESCILLDHIPHDEYSTPKFNDESTWHRSSITVWIPDVYCERCHLQFISVMSDEGHGVPVDTSCAYKGALETGRVVDDKLPACPVVYHSCSPVSIDGNTPRNEIDTCDTGVFEEKLNWPMKPEIGDVEEGKSYDYSTYYYKGNPGVYDLTDSRLMMTGYPIKNCNSMQFCDPEVYFDMSNVIPDDAMMISMQGTCAAMVTMEVEPFSLGQLPSTPKDMSEVVEVPSGESDPCSPCLQMTPCYTDACALRDEVSGEWEGAAAECTAGAPFCEECFTESPCYGFGSLEEEVETAPDIAEEEESVATKDEEEVRVGEENIDADSDQSTNDGATSVADPATGQDATNYANKFHLHSIGNLVLFWNVALLFL